METREQIFGFVLRVVLFPCPLKARGLLKGKTIGADATTLEANAAMRSIVHRDTGDNYQEFLTGLAPKDWRKSRRKSWRKNQRKYRQRLQKNPGNATYRSFSSSW